MDEKHITFDDWKKNAFDLTIEKKNALDLTMGGGGGGGGRRRSELKL